MVAFGVPCDVCRIRLARGGRVASVGGPVRFCGTCYREYVAALAEAVGWANSSGASGSLKVANWQVAEGR